MTYELDRGTTEVSWPATAFPIPVAINRAAAQNLPAGEALIRGAFDSWEGVEASVVAFRHTGLTDAKAGRDGINVVAINDSLFETSGFLAYTTTWFDDKTGQMREVDIQIDSSVTKKGVGLQTLIQHEIGHLLGFDHSGVISSVMYPWVGPDDAGGFDSDDRIGLSAAYPAAGKLAKPSLRGEVRLPGGGVFGAQVVAMDAHGAVSSALTRKDGSFEILGLPPGTYRLYAEPLDGPVKGSDLSGIWRSGTETGFRTAFSDPIEVGLESEIDGISLSVTNLPSDLNPRWVSAFAPGSSSIRMSSNAVTVKAGSRVSIAVGGDGFVSGLTEFEVLNLAFRRVSEFTYATNFMHAEFEIAPTAKSCSAVIVARNGSDSAALTGALRVAEASAGGRGRAVRR
ncbi:MAG TPA: matrixin family metalloprotease [Thermoanaerobaculia bacterium]|nr:matrixin family metalloprotease [Thermoanaerobaculia bacterium]